ILSFYNRTIAPKEYADIDLSTMLKNISSPWKWDQDEFIINQLGHPYQGSMYHQGARSNGLNFYESLAITAFGSLTYELLMENEPPSFNDVITTPIQGAFLGEMLHRVYLDTTGKIPILPALIAPQSALNHFITGKQAPNNSHSHIHEFSLGTGAGLYNTVKNNSNPLYERLNSGQVDLNIILKYGDVYGETTFVPLESFSFNAIGGFTFPSTYLVFLNADGLLLSFVPDAKYPTSFSLDLLYQYYESSYELNFSNNAIGATIQQKIDFNDKTSLEWKEQIQLSLLAGYDCHYLLTGEGEKRLDPYGMEQRLYDLGIGVGNNTGFAFYNPTMGNFKVDAFAGIYKTIPFSVQTEGSDGFSMIEYISLDYEHTIYKNLSFAVNSLFYFRQAFYDDLEDYSQFTNNTTAFIRYKFL
ncbi:MAG: DUF3943 domain-containing protein, partial [Treponema sp.]|nr:DUF3943 domain-containing protein [Treponema sp.]